MLKEVTVITAHGQITGEGTMADLAGREVATERREGSPALSVCGTGRRH